MDKEIKRRADVVGGFPNQAALLRLTGTVLVEEVKTLPATTASNETTTPRSDQNLLEAADTTPTG